jgi:hypothetical protein
MAKSSQTFKKRQRENKLREKAQLKRERRQQRQLERKATQMANDGVRGYENQGESRTSEETSVEESG